MDATHLHLILTHFPIVGTFIGILILVAGLIFKNTDFNKVGLATFIIMAILTIPVFLTGEEAEETVEHLAGVSERLIENHEEFAEVAIWFMGALGVLSLINILLILTKSTLAKTITFITLILSLVTFGVFVKVGSLGGEIRHSEIRTDAINNGANNGTIDSWKHDDDDDDDD